MQGRSDMNRKKTNTLFLSLILLLCLTVCVNAQQNAVTNGHDALKNLKPHIKKALGFVSDVETQMSSLGDALMEYRIRLDALQKYKKGQNPKTLLVDVKRKHYPVYSGGRLKTSLSVAKIGNQWKLTAIGEPHIHVAEPARNLSMKMIKSSRMSDFFLVRIPGMYQVFIGHFSGKKLFLTPTHEHADLQLDLHKAYPAEKILLLLKPLAAKYMNTLPKPTK